MVKGKRRISFFIPILILATALALGVGLSFGGKAYADTGVNAVLDESASKQQGTAVLYSLPETWAYGSEVSLPTPRLKYDTDARLTVSLAIDGSEIASEISFDEIAYYINKYMPQGEYTLTFSAGGVSQPVDKVDWWLGEQTAADGDSEDGGVDYYSGLSNPQYAFTVTKAEFDPDFAERIKSAFNGELKFVYDGMAHFLPADNILTEIESEGIYDRGEGTYWATSAADEYFDGFEITYNLIGTEAAHYHTQEYLDGAANDPDCKESVPTEPGKYRVYYNVSTRNYTDLAAYNRSDCVFRSVIVKEVELPVLTAEYNGDVQTSNIADSPYYTVISDDGGADAGIYDVVLRLRNPELYMWEGQTFENRTEEITVGFEITKAQNGWVVMPSVDRWTEGEYDSAENSVVGSAKFGETNIIIFDENDEVVYNRLAGVNNLDKAKAGVYTLTAYVSESDNWYGITGENTYTKIIRIYKKPGMEWWGILLIVLGIALVIAIVVFLLDRLGILRVMSKKHVLKMRLDADMDATKAALRFANAKQTDGVATERQPQEREQTSEQYEQAETADANSVVDENEVAQSSAAEFTKTETADDATDIDSAAAPRQGSVASDGQSDAVKEAEEFSDKSAEPVSTETGVSSGSGKSDVQFVTEEMLNEYIYGMSAERAADAFINETADADGIIVATTFDKGEE